MPNSKLRYLQLVDPEDLEADPKNIHTQWARRKLARALAKPFACSVAEVLNRVDPRKSKPYSSDDVTCVPVGMDLGSHNVPDLWPYVRMYSNANRHNNFPEIRNMLRDCMGILLAALPRQVADARIVTFDIDVELFTGRGSAQKIKGSGITVTNTWGDGDDAQAARRVSYSWVHNLPTAAQLGLVVA